VIDQDRRRRASNRRQELPHDPVFQLHDVGLPRPREFVEAVGKVGGAPLSRPRRRPAQKRDTQSKPVPQPGGERCSHRWDADLLDEVTLAGKRLVDTALVVGPEDQQRDPILFREPSEEFGESPAAAVPAVEPRGERRGDEYPPRPPRCVIVSHVGH
jgi:hypothetical protein